LKVGKGKSELVTSYKSEPKYLGEHNKQHYHVGEVRINWLLSQIDDTKTFSFSINRKNTTCRTPSQNNEVRNATAYFSRMSSWFGQLSMRFINLVRF
jgi:hypothetical protein